MLHFKFNKRKFINHIIYEIISTLSLCGLIWLYSFIKDNENVWQDPFGILLFTAFFGYSGLYPIIIMFNYRKFNKNSTITIDHQTIRYKKIEKEEIIELNEIDKIYKIKGYGVGFLPYYYEIHQKDGRKFYISYFLITDLQEYIRKNISWTQRLDLFIPEE